MKKSFFLNRVNPGKPKNMRYFVIIGTAFKIVLLAVFLAGCAKDGLKDQTGVDNNLPATIAETFPANLADTVYTNSVVEVTFKSTVNPSEISASTITLQQGTSLVPGTVSLAGQIATFTPSADLMPDTKYTATLKSGQTGNSDVSEHSWSFKTGKHRHENALSIVSVVPLKSATAVPVTIQPSATFSNSVDLSKIKALTFTLKQGTTTVEGSITYSGKTATFKPKSGLNANTLYTATISSGANNGGGGDDDDHEGGDNHEGDDKHQSANTYTWNFTTGGGGTDATAPTISTVVPANNATGVATSTKLEVNFSEAMNATTINTTNFTLKQGATAVAGSVTYFGTTATFLPSAGLKANTVYTASITTGVKDIAGNALAVTYTWSFTTGSTVDATAPTVLSSVPANTATGVANSVHPAVTFSEAMNATTINATNFTLKQGATAIAGTVAYSGTTATFTPSSGLIANTVYTATITTGVKDAAGNAIAGNYTWSFTTAAVADVTAPTVGTVVPASGATSVAVNSDITAAFSEAMNSTTITTTTFTLKQGTTAVAGLVTYSGTTATFNPAGDLTGNTVYTATITTGAQDLAGNAITTSKVWSFTTVATVAVISFSTQVMPILQAKCATCHSGSSPSGGITITNFTTVSALSNSQIDNSRMYPKMGVTPAEQAIIKAWIAAGRPNN
jgi:hypothetical protein